jgi:hypothetical protein
MNIFDSIIRFSYSRDLHEHLKGLSLDGEAYTRQSVYQIVTLVVIGLSIASILNYYFGLFNRPSFSRVLSWLLNVIGVSFIVGIISYSLAVSGVPSGAHCSYLHFFKTDCLLFGLTAFVYTTVLCIVLSTTFKWFSVNNKKVPF